MWNANHQKPSASSSWETRRVRRVKQIARLSVKLASIALILLAHIAYSEEGDQTNDADPSQVSDQASDNSAQDALPDIEAKMLHLKVLKTSTSGRVYLLQLASPSGQAPSDQTSSDSTSSENKDKPPANKILLLRNGDENVMALRVLRDITGTDQVIAKRIKKYDGYETLDTDAEFDAIEKISDIIPPPPTPEDKDDMAEVEPEPLAFDPDLDTGSSPSPNDSENDDNDSETLGASIEEHSVSFEKQKHWLVLTMGILRNTPDGGMSSLNYYAGAGLRYGYDIGRRLFVTRDERLDTFTIEAGAFFYTIGGLDSSTSTDSSTPSDSYTLAPILVTGRYTYYFNEDFGLFVYGGVLKNNVMASSNATDERVANLSQALPALGTGALLRVGPQWYTRIDAGLDMISANLMIRF
jgi:hypothetical protein